MKLAVRIQHHPKRKIFLKILLSLLDKVENLEVIEDDISTWSGCQKAIGSMKPDDTHILVLQDDILVCRDFIKTVEKIIELGRFPITFFSPKETIRRAMRFDTNWVLVTVWFMAQAYLMPRDMALDFVDWSNKHCKGNKLVDDERLAMYFYYKKQKVWATSPTLVEHLGWGDTMIGERMNFNYQKIAGRVSQYFIGVDQSGLDIDWGRSIDRALNDEDQRESLFGENYLP